MKPLKLLDAAFLHAETQATPMHVSALFLLERPARRTRKPFVERLRGIIAGRLGASEVFTRRLARMPFAVANPMWVTSGEVDLDYHVRSSTVPAPGDRRQLENRVAQLHESLLDRDRPLWELHVIEGLADGGIGLFLKVHHAGLDGMSAQHFLRAFADATPRPSTARRAPLPEADALSTTRLLAAGVRHQLAELRRLPQRLIEATSAAASLVRGRDRATPATPRTVLNEPVSGRRSFATAEIPLETARAAARAHGTTVNDLMLGLVAGALRRWLLQRGLLPRQPLFAGVPVSMRPPGNVEQAIQVAFVSVNLHTGAADPRARLAAIHLSADAAKASAGASKSLIPEDLPSVGMPWVLAGLARLVSRPDIAERVPLPFNVIVSNVPGPPRPIFVAGLRVTTYLPLSIVYHGVGLNVSVFSYDARLFVGVTACSDLLPDVDDFARYMTDEFAELQASPQRPGRRRRARTVSRARRQA